MSIMVKTGATQLKRELPKSALAYAFMVFCAFFMAGQSFAAPWVKIDYGVDSMTFSYIGWLMKLGYTPYTQAWDNKGPLLYFIEYIGALIQDGHGIFYMEFLAIAIYTIFIYKTASLFCNRLVSLAAAIFCTFLLENYLEGGNLCEEFALPFLGIGLYFLLKFFFQNYYLYWYQTISVGASAAACLMLRINLLAPILVYCGLIFLCVLFQKRWKYVGQLVLLFLVGLLLMLLPFAIYLFKHHALEACLQAAYTPVFNRNFFALMYRITSTFDVITSSNSSYALTLMLAFMAAYIIGLITRKCFTNKELWIGLCVILAFILNLCANLISGAGYLHYFISSVPLFLIPVALFFHWIWTLLHRVFNDKCKKASVISAGVVVLLLLFSSWVHIEDNSRKIFTNCQMQTTAATQIANFIQTNTTPSEKIISYGFDSIQPMIMRASRRISATRYFYSPTWGVFQDEFRLRVMKEVASDIQTKEAKLLCIKDSALAELQAVDPLLKESMDQNYQVTPYDNEYHYIFYIRN